MKRLIPLFLFLFVYAFVFGQSKSNFTTFSSSNSETVNKNTNRASQEKEVILFTYDFEDCEDFAVDQFDPCTSVDVDKKKTYSAFSSVTFPNIGYEGAFIAFNPSNATPDVSNDPRFAPRPGSTKYGVCVNVEPQDGEAIANSDWFFTPSLKLSKKAKFSFWARSTGTNYGLEKFRVWVKTPDDYSLISGNIPIEAPGEWTEFQYELDESYDNETLRFVIQCVSKDVFMFQIDDLKVTTIVTNSIVASQNNFNFIATGEEKTVAVESNVDWTAESSETWLTVADANGSNDGEFNLKAEANTTGAERTAVVTVKHTETELVETITVSQAAAEVNAPKLDLDTSPITFVAAGEEKIIAVESNVNWTVSTTDAVWLTIDPMSGSNDGEFKLKAEANTTNIERTAVVTVKQVGGTLGKTINVTQEAAAEVVIYNLTVSPSSLEFDKTGGVKNLEITSNVNWTVASSETWLSLSMVSGSNDASIVVTATENEGLSARTADITISGDNGVEAKVISVSQSALPVDEKEEIILFTYDFESCEDFVLDQFTPCVTYDGDDKKTYPISETDFLNEGYTGSFLAFNPSATTPPVNDKPHFAPRPGSNKYGICVNVDPQGGLPYANNDWFITPKLNLKHNSTFSFWAKSTKAEDYGKEKFNVYIVIASETGQDYIKISGATPVEAPGEWTEFVYELEETYDNTEARFAIQCVSNDVFIFQIDDLMVTTREVPVSISVDHTNLEFIADGEGKIVSVTSNVNWIAASDANWLTLNNESGTNNGSFTVTAQANAQAQPRVANIKVTRDNGSLEKIIVATQAAALPKLVLNPAVLDFVAAGGEKTVTVTSNLKWKATSPVAWLTVAEGNGNNDGGFKLKASANTELTARTVVVIVKQEGGTEEQTVTVTQAAALPKLELNPTVLDFVAAGGEKTVSVTSNIKWKATSPAAWLTVVEGSGSNDGGFKLKASANTDATVRTAVVTVKQDGGTQEETVTVTQAAVEVVTPKLELSPGLLEFVADGGEKTVTVTSNIKWKATSSEAWLTVVNGSGSNTGGFNIKASVNTAETARTAIVTVKHDGGSLEKTIKVSQAAAIPKLELDSSTLTFVAEGEEKTVSVTSNVNWTVASSEQWLTVEPAQGTNNGSFVLKASANNENVERTASVTVTGDKISEPKTIAITQLVPTGILENEISSNINIYPNPSADYIDISSNSDIDQLQIINMLGEVVLTQDCNTNQIKLSISNLPCAQYVVRMLTVDGEIIYAKIVKE